MACHGRWGSCVMFRHSQGSSALQVPRVAAWRPFRRVVKSLSLGRECAHHHMGGTQAVSDTRSEHPDREHERFGSGSAAWYLVRHAKLWRYLWSGQN